MTERHIVVANFSGSNDTYIFKTNSFRRACKAANKLINFEGVSSVVLNDQIWPFK